MLDTPMFLPRFQWLLLTFLASQTSTLTYQAQDDPCLDASLRNVGRYTHTLVCSAM